MLSRHSPSARILSLRPLRPPNPPKPRLFTQNSQLLLIAPHTPRPQLPYLYQPGLRRPTAPSHHFVRLLSTENRIYVRDQVWLAAKWTAIGWTFIILGGIFWFGVQIEMSEREDPTPMEWRFWTRQALRVARAHRDPRLVDQKGYVDWMQVGGNLEAVLKRLEDRSREGKGLVQGGGAGEEVLIPDVGEAGYDVSAMSWPWRSGYFEVVMGCGRAAEHLDGMVLDTTRSAVFPKDVMIGPSNPDPRPVPPYMKVAPLEENCTSPFPAPETFYMRILAGKGFTTKQRLDAALAYANWLQYKGLSESADEMYKWGVDIAKAALPLGAEPQKTSDPQSFVLADSEHATTNLLRATTELAIHHARSGQLSSALPIFLSVLRARRNAPVSPFPEVDQTPAPSQSIWSKILSPPPFPPPPPSGDIPVIRTNTEPTCEESEIMLYIGEILFATSPTPSEEGIGWTRQALNIADSQLLQQPVNKTVPGPSPEDEQQRKCKECLLTGVGNLEIMLQQAAESTLLSKTTAKKSWFSWGQKDGSTMKSETLEEEMRHIALLRDRIVKEGIDEQIARTHTSNPSGVWIG